MLQYELFVKSGDIHIHRSPDYFICTVLLYVHLKNDVFPIFFLFTLYQGNTLSHPNCFTLLVDFLTAYKSLGRRIQKNPELYYCRKGM